MATLKDYRNERLRKLEELKKLGVDPYPASGKRSHKLSDINSGFDSLEGQEVSVVGRIGNIRKFGKIAFVVVRDDSAVLQLFFRDGVVEGLNASDGQLGMDQLPLLDSGDFVQAKGKVIKTQTGEVSVEVRQLRLLTKALRPLPSAQEGFTNKEERLRRRYVDLNVNKDVYDRFIRRSKFWQARRDFLIKEGFIEINTPVLETIAGGADANPFVTYMDALNQDFYLRISHELPLKRLLVGGYEKVFDIGPRFRNENYSDEHLPEHNAMEWYWAYADWNDGMELTERLTRYTADQTWGKRSFDLANGQHIDLGPDGEHWPRISFVDVIRDNYGLDVFNCTLDQVKEQLQRHGIELEQTENRSRGIDKLWKKVRATIAGPAFLVDVPTFLQPLAKTQPGRPELTEQFNLLLGGSEMCKAYSELNDPIDQLDRFKEQQAMRDAGDDEAMMLDIDYVEALEYAMPPACGWGDSERLFWSLEGVTAREGVIFPQLRREIDEVTKGIYPDIMSMLKTEANRRPNILSSNSPLASEEHRLAYQMVVILNKQVETGRLINAANHAVAGLVGTSPNPAQFNFLEYRDKTGELDAIIMHHPAIILQATGSKEILKAYRKVAQRRLPSNVFIETMTIGSSQEEIEILKDKTIDDLDFWGLAFFGKSEDVRSITKEFQLYGGGQVADTGQPTNELPISAAEQGTLKLYLDDYALMECAASVQSIEDLDDGKYRLVLDKTCVYPGGGGQDFDLGQISWDDGKLVLTQASKDKAGIVYHDGQLEGRAPQVDATVHVAVDQPRRFLNSRLHCGGHLVDYAVQQAGKTDWQPGKGSHYPGRCYVEYKGEFNAEEADNLARQIEKTLADLVAEGGAIKPSRVKSEEAHKHSKYIPQFVLDMYQNVHVSQYPHDFNICCGGTHLTDVSQLGQVKITQIKKKDGNIRVSYTLEA